LDVLQAVTGDHRIEAAIREWQARAVGLDESFTSPGSGRFQIDARDESIGATMPAKAARERTNIEYARSGAEVAENLIHTARRKTFS